MAEEVDFVKVDVVEQIDVKATGVAGFQQTRLAEQGVGHTALAHLATANVMGKRNQIQAALAQGVALGERLGRIQEVSAGTVNHAIGCVVFTTRQVQIIGALDFQGNDVPGGAQR